MNWNDAFTLVATVLAAFAAAASAVFAALELRRSQRVQTERLERERKEATLNAFERLQREALDYLVGLSKEDARAFAEHKNENEEIKTAYHDTKTLIARCEHFAIGVHTGIYDLGLVNRLGGEHLIYTYERCRPIIETARQNHANNERYAEFETLVAELKHISRKSAR